MEYLYVGKRPQCLSQQTAYKLELAQLPPDSPFACPLLTACDQICLSSTPASMPGCRNIFNTNTYIRRRCRMTALVPTAVVAFGQCNAHRPRTKTATCSCHDSCYYVVRVDVPTARRRHMASTELLFIIQALHRGFVVSELSTVP